VGPRAGLDDVEKKKFLTLPGLELRPLGRPTRSQSLSRLLSMHLTAEKTSVLSEISGMMTLVPIVSNIIQQLCTSVSDDHTLKKGSDRELSCQ
jgi:hypothetical protein